MAMNPIALDDITHTEGKVSHGGRAPSGEYFSFATVQYYCCREDGSPDAEVVLPNKTPFILFPTSVVKACQKVAGMNARKSEVFYDTADDDAWRNGYPTAPEFPPPEYYIDQLKGYWGTGLHLKVRADGKYDAVSVTMSIPSLETEAENFHITENE
ncbi:hypothetical protein RvY_03466 [Ramazzottius varieornatus]|uniref:Apextrin C-terminal domain-containing protein n=1 Tax=Ramazzottius varieornatus TaxID=947166 RepID=A0A1D1UXH9_RAMVA|nr:hypothetical protein RvY_03466 [Ramazzottius varieornatus]